MAQDLNVALRVQADVKQGLQQLERVSTELERLEEAGARADRQSLSGLTRAITDAAQAQDTLTQNTQRALTIEERRARALARSAGSVEQQAERERRWAQARAQLTGATREQDRAATDFIARLRAQAEMIGKNHAQMAAYVARSKGFSAAIQQQAAAIGAQIDAAKATASGSAGVFSRLGTLGARAATGASGASLAGGLARVAASAAMAAGPLGLVAAAAGAVTFGFVNAERSTQSMHIALASTGNAAGATTGQIEEFAKQAGAVSGITVSAAREVAVSMLASGTLGMQTISLLTRSVQGYAAATGTSV